MSTHYILPPSNKPQNDGDDEKSGGDEIESPTWHIYSIDAHPTEHQVTMIAGLDGRQVSKDAQPNSEGSRDKCCNETTHSDHPMR
jgi:hypothetical protein